MRIVLDTNVLISAFISRGLCTELLEHCAKHHELVTSPAIIDELRVKLLTKFRIPPHAVDDAVAALFAGMEVIDPPRALRPRLTRRRRRCRARDRRERRLRSDRHRRP